MDNAVEELIEYAREETALRREQGCDTWEWERLIALFERDPGPDPLKRARKLVRSIQALEPDEDFPHDEPNDLERIRALRPEGPRSIATGLQPAALDDATLGAWHGQAAGATLGRPVCGWHRVKVDGLMRVCELDTLEDFIPPPPGDRGFEFPADVQECLRGHITHATRGPGLDMAVLCLELMEGRGTEFDSAAAAELWTTRLPWACLPRPERAAYRNLLNGLEPPRTALERNALREWTGTLARGCAWGRALPGRPEQAAGLAWRDARISHERNGIYAAMWTAATTSAAFVTDSPARALEVGLSEVPAHCRLADLLHEVQEGREAGWSAAEMVEEVMKASRSHSPMHVLSNAAVVAVALLWGDAEFSGTVGLAVQAGQDTSGNASAAGAVCGALVGAGAISDHWTEPLQDTLQTALAGTGPLSIRELADRTRRVQDRIAGRSGP